MNEERLLRCHGDDVVNMLYHMFYLTMHHNFHNQTWLSNDDVSRSYLRDKQQSDVDE